MTNDEAEKQSEYEIVMQKSRNEISLSENERTKSPGTHYPVTLIVTTVAHPQHGTPVGAGGTVNNSLSSDDNVHSDFVNIIETNDNLEMTKDNYICFTSADGTVSSDIGKRLIELGYLRLTLSN